MIKKLQDNTDSMLEVRNIFLKEWDAELESAPTDLASLNSSVGRLMSDYLTNIFDEEHSKSKASQNHLKMTNQIIKRVYSVNDSCQMLNKAITGNLDWTNLRIDCSSNDPKLLEEAITYYIVDE